MSWNNIEHIEDLKIEFKNTVLGFYWTCPRCGHKQYMDIKAQDLIYDASIKCQNTKVCGENQSYFELSLVSLIGGYKGLLDRPLEIE
jgi:transcription elongation factor Elf1